MNTLWTLLGSTIGTIVSVALVLIHIAVLCRAITRPHRTASSRVAWVAVILFLPVVGVIAYLFLGETSIGAPRLKRLRASEEGLAKVDDDAYRPLVLGDTEASLFAMVSSVTDFEPVRGNRVEMAADSNASIDMLVADINAATESVHISFYIWLDDNNGTKVAKAVSAAAKRGVTCRIMIDALGSRAFTKSPLWAEMGDAGAERVVALGDVPRFGNLAVGRPDLRNHRKIVVIDDSIGYLGSQNCADPEFRVKPKFAPWVDVFFRVQGPLVAQQQWIFLSGWFAEPGQEGTPAVVKASTPPAADANVVGAMFGTGPTARTGAMSDVFVACISAARRELVITTPYFVPDEPLLAAICAAPRRGVETTLIVPTRNDSWFVAQASDSVYERMLDAGVKLYEYPLGILHAKTMTVDDRVSLIGSANMDRRSLELNYENNVLMMDPNITADVRRRQMTYLSDSVLVDPEVVRNWSFLRRLKQNAVAMLAPLL